MILWIATHPPISPACMQGDALECTVWMPPTVLCPWHRQLEKNGRVAPAHPQSASQRQGENSVLSCGEIGSLFGPSLEISPYLEIPCKCKLEEWLKSWLLSQEDWVAQANYLCCEFWGVAGLECKAQTLGVISGLPHRCQGGAGTVSRTHIHFKPCSFLKSGSLEQRLKISMREQTFCHYFSSKSQHNESYMK